MFFFCFYLFFLNKAQLVNLFYKSSVYCYLSSLVFFISVVQDSVGGVWAHRVRVVRPAGFSVSPPRTGSPHQHQTLWRPGNDAVYWALVCYKLCVAGYFRFCLSVFLLVSSFHHFNLINFVVLNQEAQKPTAVKLMCQTHLINTSYILLLIEFSGCRYRLWTLIRLPLKTIVFLASKRW